MSAGKALIHRSHKKAVTCDKKSARQREVWLIAYRMSEKWVTREGGLYKKKKFMPARIYTGLRLWLCWWDSSGGREHRWLCLIRFSLDCSRPEGGMNVLCKQSGHTSVLPITPDVIKLHSLTRLLGAHITLITKVNISMLHPQAERSGGVGLCFNMNTRGGHINILQYYTQIII